MTQEFGSITLQYSLVNLMVGTMSLLEMESTMQINIVYLS